MLPGSTLDWPCYPVTLEQLFPHGLKAALSSPRLEHHPTALEIRGNCIVFPFKTKARRIGQVKRGIFDFQLPIPRA